MNTAEQQFLNELDAKLWKAADKLRSNLDAANYKHVVLGLIFLKYVSDAFEERQQALLELFQTDADDNIYYLPREDYDSDAAKSQTDMFNKWLQKRWRGSTKLSNKNVRHSWCIRSITEPKFSDALAARSAGHSVALHTFTYATAIEKRDMEEQAARLAS